MQKFDRSKDLKLKEFLYDSCIHDAKLKSVRYEHGENILEIEVFNPIFNVKIGFTFCNVEAVLLMRGSEIGDRKTIISLTAENDFSYLQNHLPNLRESIENSLYLLFQMFSGDELHIVSREVIVEMTK